MPDKIPPGDPLPLSDADLDELSKVTAEDVKRARELWRKAALDQFKDLLDPILIEVEEGQ
jgi:hypothetical protein